jgi:hypothetical protein
LDFTTWHTTSFFDFSFVRKTSCPGASKAEIRITAPWPKTKTVADFSEKGSRLSEPSTVRAPLTVTGISSATGFGRAGASGGDLGAETPGDEGAASLSEFFTLSVINHSQELKCVAQAR